MRLLIAGGGTGGHIYPALAVARSLRASDADVELTWLGGHRGLEAAIVRGRRIPVPAARPALAAVGRSVGPSAARSGAARAVGPTGHGDPGPPPPGRDLHHRRLRGHPGPRRRRPADPGRPVGGQRDPGPERARGPRTAGVSARRLVRRDLRGPAVGPAAAARHRDADPRSGGSTAGRHAPGSGSAGRAGSASGVRWIAGGAALQQAVAEALPRLVERVHVIHVTGDDGYAAALAGREALPSRTGRAATGRIRSSAAR